MAANPRPALRENGRPFVGPTVQERWEERGGVGTPWDYVPVPARGSSPSNGVAFTWEDDALNRKMRLGEVYPWRPGIGYAPPDSPERCKGWSRERDAPCRAYAAADEHGGRHRFCKYHLGRSPSPHGRNEGYTMIQSPGQDMDRSREARRGLGHVSHGSYSQVLRRQMAAAVEAVKTDSDKIQILADIEAMNAFDPDNPTAGIDDIAMLLMGLTARLTRNYASGQIDDEEFRIGLVEISKEHRRLLATKSAIIGSSADELEGAIDRALESLGHGGHAPPSAIAIHHQEQEVLDGKADRSREVFDRSDDDRDEPDVE